LGRGGRKDLSKPGIFVPAPALAIAGRKAMHKHKRTASPFFIFPPSKNSTAEAKGAEKKAGFFLFTCLAFLCDLCASVVDPFQ
jgi:hypothetical protein